MKSKLFPEAARKIQTCTGRWLRVTPEAGVVLIIRLAGGAVSWRILVDGQGH